jgi:hypothetical protein
MEQKFYQMPEPFKNSGYGVDGASAPPPPYPATEHASAPVVPTKPEQDENSTFRKPNASMKKAALTILML